MSVPHAIVCLPDARLRSLFSLILTDSGAAVSVCPDLESAQQMLSGRECRLLVFAYDRSLEGGETVRMLRLLAPDTELLLIAQREEVDAVLPLFRAGLSDVLLHPINPKRAVSVLQQLLGRGRPTEMLRRSGDTASPLRESGSWHPWHLVGHGPAMRRALDELWRAREDPIGVILRGEIGVEFELAAREFQAMGGEHGSGLLVLTSHEVDADMLATQISLDRLNEGAGRTYFIEDADRIPTEQRTPLLEFLRGARKRRERDKPLRIVFAATRSAEEAGEDEEFLEALQFVVPSTVRLPPLRERREDIGAIARRVLMDMTAIYPEYRPRQIHPSALQWLGSRVWPGNHAELVRAMRNAVRICPAREITPGHFGQLSAEPDEEEAAADRLLEAASRAQRAL